MKKKNSPTATCASPAQTSSSAGRARHRTTLSGDTPTTTWSACRQRDAAGRKAGRAGRRLRHERRDRPGGVRRGDLQRDGLAAAGHEAEAERELDGLPGGDRLAAEFTPDERVDVPADAEPLRERDGDLAGRLDVGLRHLDAVVDADVGLLAEPAVDADDAGAAILGVAGPDAREGGTLSSLDADEVARLEAHLLGCLFVDRRELSARVLLFQWFDDELHT